MKDDEISDWTLVWLLTSIHIAHNRPHDKAPESYRKMKIADRVKKYKNLSEILYVGDYIERAIFTSQELFLGIPNLLKRGVILEEDGYLRPTEKFEQDFEIIIKGREELLIKDELNVVAGILGVKAPY